VLPSVMGGKEEAEEEEIRKWKVKDKKCFFES
jgi:hypothetical protein